jgi:voltage-gated potassium channel Kch
MNSFSSPPNERAGSLFLKQTFTEATHPYFSRWQALINFWIFISCLTLALETVEPFASQNETLFYWVEITAVAFFAIDYLANLYFAVNRVKYFFSFWGLVDLVSILPTILMVLNLSFLQGAKVFRLLRVIRVLRVLKMARTALQQLASGVRSSNPIVTNLRIYFIALFSVMMISSTLMYYVEGELYSAENLSYGQQQLDEEFAKMQANPALNVAGLKEPEKFMPVDPVSKNPIPEDKRFFNSIPTTMWWCIVTLTTTGYGDMFPVTFWGRVIAGATMLMGLVLFGILMNIVGKTLMVLLFGESMDESKDQATRDNLVRMMVNLKMIDSAKATELSILSDEDFARRISGI